MSEVVVWDSEVVGDPNQVSPGTIDLLVSDEQVLSLSEIDHNCLNATWEIESLTPDDAADPSEPTSFRIGLLVETRADANDKWSTLSFTRGSYNGSGGRHEVRSHPTMESEQAESTIQVADQQIGSVSRHQGTLKRRFRFVVKCSEDSGASDRLTGATFSLSYATSKV